MAPTIRGRHGVFLFLAPVLLAAASGAYVTLTPDVDDVAQEALSTDGRKGSTPLPPEPALPQDDLPIGHLETVSLKTEYGCAATIVIVETGDICGDAEQRRTENITIGEGLTALRVSFYQSNDAITASGFCYRFKMLDLNGTRCGYAIFEERYEFNTTDIPAGTPLTLELWLPRPAQVAVNEQVVLSADMEYFGGPPPEPHVVAHQYAGAVGCAATFTVVQSRDFCGTALGATTRFMVPFEKNLTAIAVRLAVNETALPADLEVRWTVPGGEVLPTLRCDDTCSLVADLSGQNWEWTKNPLNAEFVVLIARATDAPAVAVTTGFAVEVETYYHGMPVPPGATSS